ncbi:FG-GAP-like repeat-containing protein [bacterium]|nr:FG-GAP-like repeat-containing protein [bacterium]
MIQKYMGVRNSLILIAILAFIPGCKSQRNLDQNALIQIFAHRNLGLGYLEENRLTEAQKEFQALIASVPDEAMPHANLGLVFLRNNDPAHAESELKQAIKFDGKNPDIRLIFAEVLTHAGRNKDALDQLRQGLQQNPNHLRCNYHAAQILLQEGNKANAAAIRKHLENVLGVMPSSLPARFQLTEVLLEQNNTAAVTHQLEEIRRMVPAMATEASSMLQELLQDLRTNKTSDANIKLRMLHNMLKPSPLYQQSIVELNGPGGSSIGFPIMDFSSNLTKQITAENVMLKSLQFVKAEPFGTVQSSPIAADLDSDGDQDLIVPKPFCVFKNDKGKFSDITSKSGVKIPEQCSGGSAADYDNDSNIDILMHCPGKNILLRNLGKFAFQDVTKKAGLAKASGRASAWIDLDEDGDLDLLLADSQNKFFRNNGDGTFGPFHVSLQLPGKNSSAENFYFADFDDDGDLDVLLNTPDETLQLWTNERAGIYKDITKGSGLENARGPIAIGDYNNDGWIDIFAGVLFRNKNGSFAQDSNSPELAQSNKAPSSFFDFDNDGHLDLAIFLQNQLYRNNGAGIFAQTSTALPGTILLISDFDSDGDEDYISTNGSQLQLVKNQGGNANHWINVRLAALAMESGKINHYGIGAQVEVRADTLYQKKVVTQTVTHFGLGPRSKADVVRVVWNNGVPQNDFLAQANQTIVEKQVLKGSCPFLYAWNGKQYKFVTDIMWRSALGMPLGFLGTSSQQYAFPDSTDEYLKIPGNALQPLDDEYRIQITEELWETVYVDRTKLMIVDHPADIDVYIDEKFVIPPFPQLHIYGIRKKIPPISAIDGASVNVLPELLHEDERYVSGLQPTRYQGLSELHDLILDPGKIPDKGKLLLFLKGWIFPTDASINVAIRQTAGVRSVQPYLQVMNKNGQWQTVIENISFPMGKNKMMILDLTGKYLTNDHRIRIRTNLQIYWDAAFFATEDTNVPIVMTNISPSHADLHYRGFSKLYRKSDYGPHLFDYNDVTVEKRWRDLEGYYTRYGDVTSLLQESDDQYVILNSGDEISIAFSAALAPPLKAGWKRDYLIHNDGWIKDGDLNTAYSKTVEPLPFQNMTQYPYGSNESYPQDEIHKRFLHTYNTRKISSPRSYD